MSKGNPRLISRVEPEEKAAFERIANERGTNASEWIRAFVRQQIKRFTRKRPNRA